MYPSELVDSATAQLLLHFVGSAQRNLTKEIPAMSTLDSLDELLQDELKDIYDAEKQLTRALPKLAKKATSAELKNAIEAHLRQTERHVERIEEAFGQLGMPARGK